MKTLNRTIGFVIAGIIATFMVVLPGIAAASPNAHAPAPENVTSTEIKEMIQTDAEKLRVDHRGPVFHLEVTSTDGYVFQSEETSAKSVRELIFSAHDNDVDVVEAPGYEEWLKAEDYKNGRKVAFVWIGIVVAIGVSFFVAATR